MNYSTWNRCRLVFMKCNKYLDLVSTFEEINGWPKIQIGTMHLTGKCNFTWMPTSPWEVFIRNVVADCYHRQANCRLALHCTVASRFWTSGSHPPHYLWSFKMSVHCLFITHLSLSPTHVVSFNISVEICISIASQAFEVLLSEALQNTCDWWTPQSFPSSFPFSSEDSWTY